MRRELLMLGRIVGFALLGVFHSRVQHVEHGVIEARFDFGELGKSERCVIELLVFNVMAEDGID